MLHRIASTMLLVLGACATTEISSVPNVAPDSSSLSGTVAGSPWKFQSGSVTMRGANGLFVATLFASAGAGCAGSSPASPAVTALVPLQPGDYAVENAGSRVNFSTTGDVNLPTRASKVSPAATSGQLTIDTVTDTRMTGRLRARFDSDNEVEGRFELTVCPGL